jgi:manganese transport protein
MIFAQPELDKVLFGLIPSMPMKRHYTLLLELLLVMPHNLYLHSSLANQKIERTTAGIKQALKYNFIDSTIALNLAFFSECCFILAAATFYRNGMFEVAEIQDAHRFLEPLLEVNWRLYYLR